MRLTLLILVVVILFIPFSYGLTASIGNARMILRTEVEEGKITEIDKSIFVRNVNNISIKVAVKPDNKYKKIIDVLDEEFILEPGEEKKARFKITLKSGGNYEGRIFVTFTPSDPEIEASPVSLTSKIIIVAEGPVTDDYYEVMGDEENLEEEPEEIEKEEPNEINVGLESKENDSVTLNPFPKTSGKDTSSIDAGEKPITKPLIGISIVFIIIIIGVGVFFIINRLKK